MFKISILNDFGITDAGNEERIADVIQSLASITSSEVMLDLTHCIIDYPATSRLIDKILEDLTKLEGKKRLFIDLSYLLPEQTLLNDLLGDSAFFDIIARREIPIEDLRRIITERIRPVFLQLVITVKDRTGNIRKQYSYGE